MTPYLLYQRFADDGSGDCSSYLVPVESIAPPLLEALHAQHADPDSLSDEHAGLLAAWRPSKVSGALPFRGSPPVLPPGACVTHMCQVFD